MRVVKPDAEGLAAAVDVLRGGGVVAYPTETVYGLGVDPHSETAVAKLFEVKGRPEANPVLLVVDGRDQLEHVVAEVSGPAEAFIARFWPGPLSLLFPRDPELADALTAGQEKVCVRCPDCDIARALCRAFGGAITSSSANRTGEAPATSVDELDVPGVALTIDGGRLPESLPSTLFDPDGGVVLREGVIPETELRDPSEKDYT